MFNWLQFSLNEFDIRLHAQPLKKIATQEEYVNTILENFDPFLIPVVKDLLAHNIDFNKDSYFSIINENGNIIAEALLGIPSKKLIIEPLDEDCRIKFLENGYTEVNISDF